VAPGIFREIFQMTPEQFKVVPRAERAAVPGQAEKAVRSSSTPGQQQQAAPADARRPMPRRPTQGAKPEVIPGWSSEVVPAQKRAP
jgi:hypothetical protein